MFYNNNAIHINKKVTTSARITVTLNVKEEIMEKLKVSVEVCKDKFEEISVDVEYNIIYELSKHQFFYNNDMLNNFFIQKSKVQDVWRYKVEVNKKGIQKLIPDNFGTNLIYVNKQINNFCDFQITKNLENNIVLLLESPHKSEIKLDLDGYYMGIAPAQGKKPFDAGNLIEKHLCDVLKGIKLKDNSYNFLIVNPIQYQTSLGSLLFGKLNNRLRNDVWLKLWKIDDMRECFLQRIEYYKPLVIINACTEKLKDYIDIELCREGYGKIIYHSYHPAVNWSIANRRIIRKLKND